MHFVLIYQIESMLFVVPLLLSVIVALAADPREEALDATHTIHPNPALIPPLNDTASLGWTAFKQCDSRWGGNRLGTCGLTVCQAGCAMSSVAMFLASKVHSRAVNFSHF